MNTNGVTVTSVSTTPPVTVTDIMGLGDDRKHTTEWSVQCTDVNGGDWVMSFKGYDGYDECDDFATEVRKYIRAAIRVADLGGEFPALLMHSDYVEASDTYRVRFGSKSIPLSSTSWQSV